MGKLRVCLHPAMPQGPLVFCCPTHHIQEGCRVRVDIWESGCCWEGGERRDGGKDKGKPMGSRMCVAAFMDGKRIDVGEQQN